MNAHCFAVLISAGLLAGCSQKAPLVEAHTEGPAALPTTVVMAAAVQKESGIQTDSVHVQALPETLRAPARLTNDENRTWRVGSIAEGRIVHVKVSVGDVVTEGQILAQLHSHDVHESRALFKKAKADLARAKGVVEYAQRQRERAQRLLDLKAGSVAQVEQKDTELRNAETEVNNAVTELERTRTHLEEVLGIPAEESSSPQTGNEDDDDLIPIRAPAAGVILTRNVTPGTVVTPASDLFLISDLNQLWAIAQVSEEHLGQLRPGMPVRVFVQAYGEEAFVGRIGKLGDLLDPNTRTIQVRIDLANPRNRLKPEMYATAEVALGAGVSAVVVPTDAVQEVRGQMVVFVKTAEDTFTVRPVTIGRTIDRSYEITGGLQDGESIANRSTFILKSEFLKASMAGE